jgi:GINS complex subunit 1
MVPPKDPYIQVRVLEDIGEVSLGDHSVSLTKNSLHFLRRTDAEQFISQVFYLFLCDILLSLLAIFSGNNTMLNLL